VIVMHFDGEPCFHSSDIIYDSYDEENSPILDSNGEKMKFSSNFWEWYAKNGWFDRVFFDQIFLKQKNQLQSRWN